MLNTHRLQRRTAHCNSRGGFTLVELLVVIGIIAILAGVALGPITSGIKKGQQSAGVQTARTLALAEFQYSNDNNQVYPSGTDASKVADALVAGGYIQDPGIFIISGSVETKYVGTTSPPNYAISNVSWDFGCGAANVGLTPNAPDQTPLVVSSTGATSWATGLSAVGPTTVTVASGNPFGLSGMAVCFKSNSAKFLISSSTAPGSVQLEDASWQAGQTITDAAGGG